MSAALGLDPLLAALREAGLPVGVAEMARLQRVFALGPQLEKDRRLRSILRAVLVKSAEDRARFDPVFDVWMDRAGQEMTFREAPPSPRPLLSPPPLDSQKRTPQRKRLVWRALAAAALPLLVLMVADEVRKPTRPAPIAPIPEKPPESAPVSTARVLTPDEIRKKTFETWVPTLTVTPEKPEWQGWPALTLGCLALLATGGLWAKARRKSWLPEPAPEPAKKGPPRVFLTPPNLAGPQLLEPREQEALVWGIGHFVAEEPTRRLDLAATVRDTAKAGGIPHLLFHQARYPREVWLWIDEAADDPSILRIAEEIEAALQTHGLPIERALFRGVPDLLVNASGQTFAPNEVDERRDAALVAILTDGRVLTRQYAADDRRVRLDALLRSLSRWPRLAFVDFAAEPGDLSAILLKHSLARITPSSLAAFLGSDETAKRKTGGTVSGDAVWAAACAVAPASVDELRAFQLRRRLGLATSPWALRILRTEAPGPPGRLQWQPEDRARRVNWLTAAEAQTEDSVASGSLLGRTLDFWEEVYDRELKGDSWLETPAHQHLAMERALLSLWRDPREGARELYRFHGGTLREPIEGQLQDLAPANWGRAELLHLPWSWESLPTPERVMLQQMGLGGGMPEARLRRPGRLWTGLGLGLGLAVGALGAAALSGWRQPEGPPLVVHGPGRPADAIQEVQEEKMARALFEFRGYKAGERVPSIETYRTWNVTVGTRTSLAWEAASAQTKVHVRWKQQRRPCVSRFSSQSILYESWACGTIKSPVRFGQSSKVRVVVLESSLNTHGSEALAVDLLDSGSADQVAIKDRKPVVAGMLIGTLGIWRPLFKGNWLAPSLGPYEDFPPEMGFEVLVIPRSDWSRMRQALRFEGIRTVQEVWPDVKLLAGSPSAKLRGLLSCRNGEAIEENGMTFVRICPGTFTMGSAADDPKADGDEKLPHNVNLSEYWIGKSEVTNAQYRSDHPDHLGPDALPATRVNWYEAKGFCERHGWRLPTEAEWEYAARAGTQTPWSFGTNELQIGEYAWFEGNSGLNAQPVATRKPNPWGLYDMHGNAEEWVEDWYGPYKFSPHTNSTGPVTGKYHILRGGSFVGTPWDLRSAGRDRNHPSDRIEIVGFRCARNPRPQP